MMFHGLVLSCLVEHHGKLLSSTSRVTMVQAYERVRMLGGCKRGVVQVMLRTSPF